MKIGIIGSGNVGWNLVAGLAGSPFEVVQVMSRRAASAKALAEEFGIVGWSADPWDLRKDLDVALMATTDHSVGVVAKTYADKRGKGTVFAHTSGSMPLARLEPLGDPIGVFYPLQSFTRGRLANWREVPVFLEGNAEVVARLRPLAEHLSGKVSELDSAGRLRLHLGAVFAHNFANYMWLLAEDAVRDLPGGGLQYYEPLIRECVEKAFSLGPYDAHTGPARRGDQGTMDKHLDLLEGDAAEIYKEISRMITDRFKG